MSHHQPFKSLGPLSWNTDIAPHATSNKDNNGNITNLFTSTLANAQLLIDSIPPSPSSPTTTTTTTPKSPGRARSHTDSAISPPSTSTTTACNKDGTSNNEADKAALTKLSREWKDLKMHQANSGNPHGIAMYKMGAKDGKGAWFARRSLHRVGPGGVGFERWEAALKGEMQVTLDRVEAEPRKEPGTGNVRGIGAERRVERVEFEGGKMDVYHVSARFPGPTTPRDFVTVIMMPNPNGERKTGGRERAQRQFMVVSRPCDHPDCPPRPGFVRGTYESVEVIREVPVEKPIRRVRSSVDFSRDEVDSPAVSGERMSKEAVLRAAKQAVGEEAESEGEGRTVSFRLSDDNDSDMEMAIEWLMVTRSDPGGSVPRFMVEKGTPGGIINDAGKFIKWLSSESMEELTKPRPTTVKGRENATKPTGESPVNEGPGQLPVNTAAEDQLPDDEAGYQEGPSASSSGIYGMLSSALGMATTAVANKVAAFTPASIETDSEFSDDESDVSDGASFASAEDGSATQVDTSLSSKDDNSNKAGTTTEADIASNQSTHSLLSETTSQALSREATPSAKFSQAQSQHEKELRKLQQRMHKAQEKLERAKARRLAKENNNNNGNGTTDPDTDSTNSKQQPQQDQEDQAITRLHEKHAREVARQEEKYQRELQRLADKRAGEERKAAERRRKAAERAEKGNLSMELARVRAERDVARKEVEMLRERVGELQGQNTRLVARLGREGVGLEGLALPNRTTTRPINKPQKAATAPTNNKKMNHPTHSKLPSYGRAGNRTQDLSHTEEAC
ncbi:hypothetical protein CHGG_03163 [Chaetomium globosum CBS 148.51]|uniref:DUF3074 domain-containing protein n=1 Tax=Chaetomium globosum (strain ATCC 6205 / CBS 148.51 / DSM 1962 / NBRC 6347 / NRRL 1970) TaxID=306901 RepID=Q2H9E1_CHAGB|nr:uncharacterized protein CHGG_03163 [Chaetomium globosum CBS 148.51]EAQ91228.1 hypothetical protein CHGG_03163 [Chaetomium globosum CBS 148.51]